jgi:hypothetical protein
MQLITWQERKTAQLGLTWACACVNLEAERPACGFARGLGLPGVLPTYAVTKVMQQQGISH